MTDTRQPVFRCGWRVFHDEHLDRVFGAVQVRRGLWRANLDVHMYEMLSGEQFANLMARQYRETAFEHIEADLDILARQVIGELENGNGLIVVPGVSYDDVIGALKRYEAARKDMQ